MSKKISRNSRSNEYYRFFILPLLIASKIIVSILRLIPFWIDFSSMVINLFIYYFIFMYNIILLLCISLFVFRK